MKDFKWECNSIFKRRTYGGLLFGNPTVWMGVEEINHMKIIAKSFCWLEPYVHLTIDSNKVPLQQYSYAAWITSYTTVDKDNGQDTGSHACIIWFDNDDDYLRSMNNMLKEIDWESVAINWDF